MGLRRFVKGEARKQKKTTYNRKHTYRGIVVDDWPLFRGAGRRNLIAAGPTPLPIRTPASLRSEIELFASPISQTVSMPQVPTIRSLQPNDSTFAAHRQALPPRRPGIGPRSLDLGRHHCARRALVARRGGYRVRRRRTQGRKEEGREQEERKERDEKEVGASTTIGHNDSRRRTWSKV